MFQALYNSVSPASYTWTTLTENLQVDWEGPDDPENPKNWPLWRKWVTTLLTSLGGLVTLMSGAMMAPALSDISHELNIAPEEAQIALSIFILAFAFGPLFLGPCSEVFGRKPVWLVSSTCYVIWNVICGFATKRGTMMASRFFSGIGASAQFAVSQHSTPTLTHRALTRKMDRSPSPS